MDISDNFLLSTFQAAIKKLLQCDFRDLNALPQMHLGVIVYQYPCRLFVYIKSFLLLIWIDKQELFELI